MIKHRIKAFAIGILVTVLAVNAQKPVGENWLKTNVPAEDAICFALYTVSNKALKMTAQLYPLADDIDRVNKLQIRRDDGWQTIAASIVSEESYGWPLEDKKQWTAHFRLEEWDHSRDYDYRLLAAGGAGRGELMLRTPNNQVRGKFYPD